MDRDDHTRSAIEERVQKQRRSSAVRRYTLTLEVSPDDVVGGYTATEASYEPGGMVGRGASPREAIADWIREAEHEGHDPEDAFVDSECPEAKRYWEPNAKEADHG